MSERIRIPRLSHRLVATILALGLGHITPRAQSSHVVIPDRGTALGDSSSVLFADVPSHLQTIYGNETLKYRAAIVNEMVMRPGLFLFPCASRTAQIELRLSTTTVKPGSMSTAFASNLTRPTTLAFKGNVLLPTSVPLGDPNAWTITIKLQRPYAHNTALGNLLIDIRVLSTSKTGWYQADFDTRSDLGQVRHFGVWGKFSNPEPFILFNAFGKLLPGTDVDIGVLGLSRRYKAFLFIGTSRKQFAGYSLPMNLGVIGAPGQELQVAPDVVHHLRIRRGLSSYEGYVSYSIPPTMPSASRFYSQLLLVDKNKNAPGIVLSPGIEIELGYLKSELPIRTIYSGTPRSNSGKYLNLRGGSAPIWRLVGQFF